MRSLFLFAASLSQTGSASGIRGNDERLNRQNVKTLKLSQTSSIKYLLVIEKNWTTTRQA